MTNMMDPLAANCLDGTRAARAQALLQLPDRLAITFAAELREGLAGDGELSTFLDLRIGALHARREADGILPEPMVQTLTYWRRRTVQIAAGVLPGPP